MHVEFKYKIIWTILALLVYFILCNVWIYGLDRGESTDMFEVFRTIMAGASGSVLDLGISPIVTASIILQLFAGAKIINLDMGDPDDQRVFQGTQKLLALGCIVIMGLPKVLGQYPFMPADPGFEAAVGGIGARALIFLQLAIGGYIIMMMDEVVSKWGIGSGISLFIAAGVSWQIFTGIFSWLPNPEMVMNPLPIGCIPWLVRLVQQTSILSLLHGGYERMLLGASGLDLNPIIALLGAVLIFTLVAYMESCRVELPIVHERVRGARGKYPLKLIYASVIPVILIASLLGVVNMMTQVLWVHPEIPLLGHNAWIGAYEGTKPIMGMAYYINAPMGIHEWLLPLISPANYPGIPGRTSLQIAMNVVVYTVIMIIGCIFFAKFWIETTNMSARDVAKRIQSSGMQIPGFRRDVRVLERVLNRYIPTITVLSGVFVGVLAVGSNLIGCVGRVGGMGLLLLVGILIDLYEQIQKEQAMEMHPLLRGFLGEG